MTRSTFMPRNTRQPRQTNQTGRRSTSRRAAEDGLMLLAGIGAGLAAMYLLDPQHGGERRQYLRRRAGAAMETAGETLGSAWNNVSERASDAASNLKERGGEAASDWAQSAREMLP